MIPFLATLNPDVATLFLTLGLALIALELNRPGFVVPGAVGLLLTLLSGAVLFHAKPCLPAITFLVSAALLLLLQSRLPIPLWMSVFATLLGTLGFAYVPHVHLVTAVVCGLFLGAGTTVLTRLARRARRNKGLD